MAISFPTSLDNFSNPASTDSLNTPSHSLQHTDLNDAVEAMQRKVGVGTAVAGSASAGQVLTISAAGTSTWSTPTAGGLVLISTTSFSSVNSTSLPNDTFTTTYDKYLAIYRADFSTAANCTIRLRAAGSDLSSALYRYAVHHVSTNADHLLTTGNTQTSGQIVTTNLTRHTAEMTFYRPKLEQKTQINHQFGSGRDSTVFASAGYGTNEYDATTSVDSFTLIFSQTVVSGEVSVYGYSK